MARGGGDSEKVANSNSAGNDSNEDTGNEQATTEQGSTTQTGDDSQQGTGSQESATVDVAEVNGKSYSSLQAAIDAATRNATVKLLADTYENVTISTPYVTLDLNGHTLNGGTEKGKPALTVTARVTVKDGSEAQTGTIKREDTAENSGVSSHYVIDIQGSGWLTFESGNVTNNSGNTAGKGASLVRVGDDSVAKYPGLNIKGGTFTQNKFIVIKVDSGNLFLNGGTLNCTDSYAIEDWHRATIKGGTVNGAVAAWTYSGGHNSDLTISGGTVNGKVESVTYDGAEGKTAKVSITGGTVNGSLSAKKYNSSETIDPTKATIEVTGGTFSTDPSRYLIESSAATQNADGTYGVAKAYLAQVGETSYYTMDEAFKAQTASGEAITLLRDYTTGSEFNSGTVARVVDLNGHTWTCTGTDASSAAFEINYADASLTVKNGKVVSSQLIGLIPSGKDGLTGSTIAYNNSTLTFEDVEASTTATSGIETNGNNANDTVVLKNSTLNVPNGFGIYFPSSGTLTIDNSTINAKTMGVQVCSGNLNVNAGSKITVSGDPVAKTENDGAIQDGAAISVVNRPGYKGLGQVAITGGAFTAKAGNAALKAYAWDSSTKQESAFDNTAKKVTVSGGTFSSAVSSDLCVKGSTPVKNDDGTYSVGAPVAKIGTKGYAALADAVAAAGDGQTVTLLGDVEQNSQLTIDKSITLDLNGKTISNTVDIWGDNTNAILSITNGAKVTITGNGTIDAKENDCYAINVVKGDLTIENGTFYGNVSVVQVQEGTLSVKGGTFDLHQKWEGSSKYLFNCIDDAYVNGSANVAISGGTFVGFDPNVSPEQKVDGKAPSFAAPGAGVTKNEDGSFTAAADMAAQILDKDGNSVKAYKSLTEAIDAAEDGQTVTLLGDATENITIAASKQITLDLNGHTLNGGTGTAKAAILNKGTVTITDTSTDKTGTIKRDDQGIANEKSHYVIDNNGTMVIDQANVFNNSGKPKSKQGSSLVRNGGVANVSSLTINGGTFEQHNFIAVKNDRNGELAINGGTLTSKQSVVQNWNKAQILGGNLTGIIWTDSWTEAGTVGETVIGGDAHFTGGIYMDVTSSNPSTLKIKGGSLDVTKWTVTSAAAEVNSSIAVSGGTFNTEVPADYCADGFAPAKTTDASGNVTYGVSSEVATMKFLGGSLRMDYGDSYDKTCLRFGYHVDLPEGATLQSWSWDARFGADSTKTYTINGVNKVQDANGNGFTANLVITNIGRSYYSEMDAVRMTVVFKTKNGDVVTCTESAFNQRSVNSVANAIVNSSTATDAEINYAKGILGQS